MTDGAPAPLFDAVRDKLIASVRAGASVDEAARRERVNVSTVRCWLTKGRKAPTGRYGRFASEVDAARQLRRLPEPSEQGPLTLAEVESVLAGKVRAGSVPAMRLWLDLHPQDATPLEDDLSWLDPPR